MLKNPFMSIISIIIILTAVLFNITYAQDIRDASAESYIARASEILQHDRKQIESLRLKQIKEMDLREKTKKFEERQQNKLRQIRLLEDKYLDAFTEEFFGLIKKNRF